VTNDMKTVLFAGVSFTAFIIGALASIIVSWVQRVT
jgi:hypothetical protein